MQGDRAPPAHKQRKEKYRPPIRLADVCSIKVCSKILGCTGQCACNVEMLIVSSQDPGEFGGRDAGVKEKAAGGFEVRTEASLGAE